MKKIILIILIIMMTGCYDYKELNKIDLISSTFVDYKDDKFEVTIEILDTGENTKKASYFLNGSGDNFAEAVNDIFKEASGSPYYDHMNVLIISPTIAKSKLEDIYDNLARDPNLRKDFYILLCEEIDSYKNYEIGSKVSLGETISNIVDNNLKNNAKFVANEYREILDSYLNNKNYLIGSIEFNEKTIKLKDTYLIKDNKLEQKLDNEIALLQNIFNNTDSSFQIHDKSSYDIYDYKLKQEIKENKIIIDLKTDIRLINITDGGTFSKEDINILENKINTSLKNLIEDGIKYSKTIDCDIFNFNYQYYLNFPQKTNDKTWQNIEYEIKVKSNINEKGLILDSVGESK